MCTALGTNDYDRYTAKRGVRCVSLEGLDVGFGKVVLDFVVASGNHVEQMSWDK